MCFFPWGDAAGGSRVNLGNTAFVLRAQQTWALGTTVSLPCGSEINTGRGAQARGGLGVGPECARSALLKWELRAVSQEKSGNCVVSGAGGGALKNNQAPLRSYGLEKKIRRV